MGAKNRAKQLTANTFFIEWARHQKCFCGNCIYAKNHRVHGQIKRKPSDFTHIFSVSTIDAIFLLPHALFWQDMYDVHRFDARKFLWCMGIQLNKYTTFYYMTLAVLCKKQDGTRIKICETFSGNSLKGVSSEN